VWRSQLIQSRPPVATSTFRRMIKNVPKRRQVRGAARILSGIGGVHRHFAIVEKADDAAFALIDRESRSLAAIVRSTAFPVSTCLGGSMSRRQSLRVSSARSLRPAKADPQAAALVDG
jgi:hypothetical protein